MSATHFNELPYQRPDLDAVKAKLSAIHSMVKSATSGEELIAAVNEWNKFRIHIMTMQSLAEVHFTQDTSDELRKAEKHFFDENGPTITEWNIDVERALLDSPFKQSLVNEFGELFITILENGLKVFSPEIKPLLIEESELCNRYNEITAQANIDLDGETYNLSTIGAVAVETNRDRRKRATTAMYEYIGKNAEELDNMYDRLVKLRTEKAKALGFSSYTEFRYIEMGRVDYTPEDVKKFREQVLEYVVPLSVKARDAQRKRLGLDSLTIYDEKLVFSDGNPIADGDHDFIVDAATKMYAELSPETHEFFQGLLNGGLMDLKSRNNKATGGYCTSFAEFKLPFIFANFNKTTHDVEVLTHEAGHAFQAYRSRNQIAPEYYWPTAEACEIHSMSMEFLTWPWMDLFFGEQTEKFRFYHLEGAIRFVPYACAVDEFQHWVYANPDVTPAERNAHWSAMERKYMPWRDVSEVPEAAAGRQWQFQRHIYESPFYYIDYALAQMCSLQYWKMSQADAKQAFKDYLNICDVGGSQSFLQIVKSGRLESPFSNGALGQVFSFAHNWLQKEFPQYA